MSLLKQQEWDANVFVPNVFGLPGDFILSQSLVRQTYEPLVFCMGVVLLFSRERGRRRSRLDWTRRWGVLASYVVLLLSAAQVLFIAALVGAGIGALFMSMPAKYQPAITDWFVEISAAYLRYGPGPGSRWASLIQVIVASLAILLACVPLWDAMRACGPKWRATILVTPLVLFALMHLAHLLPLGPNRHAMLSVITSVSTSSGFVPYSLFFWPELAAGELCASPPRPVVFWRSGLATSAMEVVKWGVVFLMALWLTAAQVSAWRQRKPPGSA